MTWLSYQKYKTVRSSKWKQVQRLFKKLLAIRRPSPRKGYGTCFSHPHLPEELQVCSAGRRHCCSAQGCPAARPRGPQSCCAALALIGLCWERAQQRQERLPWYPSLFVLVRSSSGSLLWGWWDPPEMKWLEMGKLAGLGWCNFWNDRFLFFSDILKLVLQDGEYLLLAWIVLEKWIRL